MFKFKPFALTLSAILLLTACGESEEERQKKIIAQQQQQIAEQRQDLQNAIQQQQQIQPQQYAPQPQVIQQPAAPVIVQQPVAQQDNTIRDMATGALIGHALSNLGGSNDRPAERVVEHKTVVIHNQQTPAVNSIQPYTPSQPAAPVPSAPLKQNYMDMNKLSQSAKYSPPSVSKPVSVSSKPSSMNMSKLSRK
jgi:hypothetical protein